MRTICFALAFCSLTFSCSQNLDDIICDISDINIVEYESVGIGGWKGKNYSNYELLIKRANIDQLLGLIEHENPVVACYASWGLIDKEYKNLPKLFEKIIKEDRVVKTQSGCTLMGDVLYSEFYHRYWNLHRENNDDEVLFELDKIILKQEKPHWLLLSRALENRVYPKEFKEIIYKLGFEKHYLEAIFYLCNWHKSEFNYELQLFLVEELKETEFQGKNSSSYYKLIDELLRFKNEKLNDFIMDKIRRDPPSINITDEFKGLLDRNYLY